jgi:uncharacterized protein
MKNRALVLCEDAWHSGVLVQDGLRALAGAPFDFDFTSPDDDWTAARLKEFAVVVLAKSNHVGATVHRPWISVGKQSAFRNFVRSGGGLFAVHSGVCYRELPEMRHLVGGAFLSHPDPCPVTIQPKLGHPLTANVASFTVHDEHYFLALDAADADVFLHTHSQHGTQPAGWIRTEGEGRVCVLTPGHNREVWAHPEYQTLLRNGLVWLASDLR